MDTFSQAVLWTTSYKLPDVFSADVIFVHARNDLADEMIELAVDRYLDGRVAYLVINGSSAQECAEARVNYDGKEAWLAKLKTHGIQVSPILPSRIMVTEKALHTGAEARVFQELCAKMQWSSMIVMATPYHILRCMLTQLAVMKERRRYFRMYPQTLSATDWTRSVKERIISADGSENFLERPRLDIILEEHKKILEYTRHGYCALPSDLIEYLKKI